MSQGTEKLQANVYQMIINSSRKYYNYHLVSPTMCYAFYIGHLSFARCGWFVISPFENLNPISPPLFFSHSLIRTWGLPTALQWETFASLLSVLVVHSDQPSIPSINNHFSRFSEAWDTMLGTEESGCLQVYISWTHSSLAMVFKFLSHSLFYSLSTLLAVTYLEHWPNALYQTTWLQGVCVPGIVPKHTIPSTLEGFLSFFHSFLCSLPICLFF